VSDSAIPSPTPADRRRDVSDFLHVRLFTVDALTIAAGRWNTRDVRSPFWRFYRNEGGGASLLLDGGAAFPLEAGRVYFVPAGVRFSCRNDAAFAHFYAHFDLVGLPSLTLRTLFTAPVALARDAAFEGRVADFADAVRQSSALDLAGQCRAKGLVCEALARSLSALPPEGRELPGERARRLEAVAPALLWIESHPGQPVGVPELAALCCLSPDHFARRFRECVGQPPGRYLLERRVTQAARLLLLTDDSLESIATACGLGNRHYLTRVFTRSTGVSPAAYRREGAGRDR
jgi:AraC-like DNA-binding protein